ncbi:Site-specific recombinase XerD [Halogranum rubrum]|uniref:Site-specific recombinase XerD n=1 Tax=Halogranum rubrum TaxID=553466 RepID=A0A1I4I8U2_9EURY|nr:tyrosine-type recombinase/integrase [Halogranum rubrum]SFL50730.1 Site-specific recombinase XerD [Halogranum rubrum]
MSELEPITPADAKEMYLASRQDEVTEATYKAHNYRLNHFIRWCNEYDIDNLNDINGRSVHRYRLWRRDDGDLNNVTLKTQLDTLRVFIRFCEGINAVEDNLHDKVISPTLKHGENQRDVMLEADTAEDVLEYLHKFEYASCRHTLLEILWHTGIRTGSAHSLDVDDYYPRKACLKLRHRPETETRLKNGKQGERFVALNERVCRVVDDWLDTIRPNVTDDYDRNPLFASKRGRLHKNTMRAYVYHVTSPCYYTGECPHGRSIDDCEATSYGQAHGCPSSISPHAIRRGSITHHLSSDVPEKVVSDRMNVGQKVLDAHYDRRSEEQKLEQRRGYLGNI